MVLGLRASQSEPSEKSILCVSEVQITGSTDDGVFPIICTKNARQYTKYYLRFLAHLPENPLAPTSTAICSSLTGRLESNNFRRRGQATRRRL